MNDVVDSALGPGRAPKSVSNPEDAHGQNIIDAAARLNDLIAKGRDMSIKTRLELPESDVLVVAEITWQPPRKVIHRQPEEEEADA